MLTKYQIRILVQCGSTSYWTEEYITAKRFEPCKTYYYFWTDQDKAAYYPVNGTIVTEL